MRRHFQIGNPVLSTVHELGSEVVKIRKRPGTKSMNAKGEREAFGAAEEKRAANYTLY